MRKGDTMLRGLALPSPSLLGILFILLAANAGLTCFGGGPIPPGAPAAGASGAGVEDKIPAIDTIGRRAVFATGEQIKNSPRLIAASGVIEVDSGYVFFKFRTGISLGADEFKVKFEKSAAARGYKIMLHEKPGRYPYLYYYAHIEEVSSPGGRTPIEQVRLLLGMMTDVDAYSNS